MTSARKNAQIVFCRNMKKSYVAHLPLPEAVNEKLVKGKIVLITAGADYDVEHDGGSFREGWKEFCTQNGVKENDSLVFRQKAARRFNVEIFSKDGLEKTPDVSSNKKKRLRSADTEDEQSDSDNEERQNDAHKTPGGIVFGTDQVHEVVKELVKQLEETSTLVFNVQKVPSSEEREPSTPALGNVTTPSKRKSSQKKRGNTEASGSKSPARSKSPRKEATTPRELVRLSSEPARKKARLSMDASPVDTTPPRSTPRRSTPRSTPRTTPKRSTRRSSVRAKKSVPEVVDLEDDEEEQAQTEAEQKKQEVERKKQEAARKKHEAEQQKKLKAEKRKQEAEQLKKKKQAEKRKQEAQLKKQESEKKKKVQLQKKAEKKEKTPRKSPNKTPKGKSITSEDSPAMLKAKEFKSNYPTMIALMKKSNLAPAFLMTVPTEFARAYMPSDHKEFDMLDTTNKIWNVRWLGPPKCSFSGGWCYFAQDHNLQLGDAIAMEVLGAKDVKIHVFKADEENTAPLAIETVGSGPSSKAEKEPEHLLLNEEENHLINGDGALNLDKVVNSITDNPPADQPEVKDNEEVINNDENEENGMVTADEDDDDEDYDPKEDAVADENAN